MVTTHTDIQTATIDHVGDFLHRKQVRPAHFAASLDSLGSIVDQFDVLFDFIKSDKDNDFTAQFLQNHNQGSRHGRN